MSVRETLDFACFAAIQCNGTTALAEIHRVVMKDLDTYRDTYVAEDSMFDFLCHMFRKLWPETKGIGSCTDPRFTYCAGSSDTNWCNHQMDLLDLCMLFYANQETVKTKKNLNNAASTFIHELVFATDQDNQNKKKKKFKGVRTMGAIQFLHIAAMFGLIPLYCYTFAELTDNDLGPPKFIRAGLSMDKKAYGIKECNIFFKALVTDLQGIWGAMMTPALIENLLCELSRCYKKTSSREKRKDAVQVPCVDIILDSNKMVDGEKNDICFFDHERNCVQNFFLVSVGDAIRPELIMKKSRQWGELNAIANISLTNWTLNKDDNKHLRWSAVRNKMTLDTKLLISDELEKEYLISDEI